MADLQGPPPTARGYDAREVVSALQKAVRRSDPGAASEWAVELVRSGYGGWFWKRAKIIAVEDCSPEATGLVADIKALAEQWKEAKNDGLLFVVRAAVSLAIAPKSRLVDWMAWTLNSDDLPHRPIPDEALDKHTARGRRLGRGRQHFIEEASKLVPFGGDLAALEAEYRERAIASGGKGAQKSATPSLFGDEGA